MCMCGSACDSVCVLGVGVRESGVHIIHPAGGVLRSSCRFFSVCIKPGVPLAESTDGENRLRRRDSDRPQK